MRPTASGLVFLLLGAALAVAAYRFALPGMLPVAILLMGLVALSAVIALATSARLSVGLVPRMRRFDGENLTAVGAQARFEAHVSNRTPLPVGSFTLTLTPEDGFGPVRTLRVPGLAARAETSVPVAVVPTRRGLSGIESVRLRLEGPFGLIALTRTARTGLRTAVAVPDQVLPVRARPHMSAEQSESDRLQRGTSTLDFHTREYAPGDDLRHVHWASTARYGTLMIREQAHEESPVAVVLLDTLGADPTGHGADIAVTAAAAVALHHLSEGTEVLLSSGPRLVRAAGAKGRDTVRLESARHPAGAEVPAVPALPPGTRHVAICALQAERARALAAELPRSQPHSLFVVEELADDGVSLETALFGGELRLPPQWRHGAETEGRAPRMQRQRRSEGDR
ncbi:DUF58 domain-containing protein [Brevibacterium album]|uniref:DUF58 domain-containing protein n=1 Tax=Brevibacterium album TaxID=417948 RepID=UPI000401C26F|nr:DUF58 domain-containing protein [Brevibacterium album]